MEKIIYYYTLIYILDKIYTLIKYDKKRLEDDYSHLYNIDQIPDPLEKINALNEFSKRGRTRYFSFLSFIHSIWILLGLYYTDIKYLFVGLATISFLQLFAFTRKANMHLFSNIIYLAIGILIFYLGILK